jgi:AraC-like DNA-binding protein
MYPGDQMRSGKEFHWEMDLPVLEPQINAQGVHVYPFDPSFPVDIRFFECGDHHGVRMNRHDYFELIYVHSGEATFQIHDRLYPAKCGDLVMIGNTLYHRQLARLDGIKDRVVVLIFKQELIHSATTNGDEFEYLMPFFAQRPDLPPVILSETRIPGRIFELIKEINCELPASTNRARLAVKTYLKMILVLLVNHFSDSLGTQRKFNHKQQSISRLRPLFEWIDRMHSDPISVTDAAKVCAMSTSYFMRYFKQATGQSFLAYLNNFRVAKAQILLATTDKSISEISQEVGFCDQSYFGMMFRKLTRTTPMAYRRRSLKAPDITLLTDHSHPLPNLKARTRKAAAGAGSEPFAGLPTWLD